MEAEREIAAYYAALFMKDKVGERFPGNVAAVAEPGLFVELTPFFVEGLVRAETLPGMFDLDPVHHALVDRGTGRAFRVGDPVEVQVADVSIERRRIDLALVSELPTSDPALQGAARPPGRKRLLDGGARGGRGGKAGAGRRGRRQAGGRSRRQGAGWRQAGRRPGKGGTPGTAARVARAARAAGPAAASRVGAAAGAGGVRMRHMTLSDGSPARRGRRGRRRGERHRRGRHAAHLPGPARRRHRAGGRQRHQHRGALAGAALRRLGLPAPPRRRAEAGAGPGDPVAGGRRARLAAGALAARAGLRGAWSPG